MPSTKKMNIGSYKWALAVLIGSGLVILAGFPAFGARGVKDETIEATAMGTNTQMGAIVGISVEIYDYSTPADNRSSFRHSRQDRTRAW